MPARKHSRLSRNPSRVAKLNGTPAPSRGPQKRAASELPEAQACIKVATREQQNVSPPDDGRTLRESPCMGCLVLMTNWMPEDGEPKLCYVKPGGCPDRYSPAPLAGKGMIADSSCSYE